MSNHLKGQSSPYLLEHAQNPVDWYPWGEEAFDKARREDKPVFLSIGYSSCHWCHVMARESFEDADIAEILNRHFVSVKVDKEERPDIDSIYMAVCEALTGSGGWPTSIFMTAEGKPFFAGTYFPKTARGGMPGFGTLLRRVAEAWREDRQALLTTAGEIASALAPTDAAPAQEADAGLLDAALRAYKQSYDEKYGGFGRAPKFPAPHNLLFLMTYTQKYGDGAGLAMAEKTLGQMYAGGLFDHIGYGFCRYSTDRYFLVPHFEKMLYDNALLMLAYCKAYDMTQDPFYLDVAEKTAAYVLREMTGPAGGFFSAQDADSGGEEGKYYLLTPAQTVGVLGEGDGAAFNARYDVTPAGNFEGKSIPNLLHAASGARTDSDAFAPQLAKLRAYRRERNELRTDDKMLTAWNALMIAALCALYRMSRKPIYLDAAKNAQGMIERALCEGDGLYVSFRDGKRGARGFVDEYASCCFALLALYGATLDTAHLERARALAQKAIADFFDPAQGGFYLYGKEHEALLFRPKETYDGAIPSGNSIMSYVLVRLCHFFPEDAGLEDVLQKQMAFLCARAAAYPMGHAAFLTALSDHLDPPAMITAVLQAPEDGRELPFLTPLGSLVRVLPPTADYPLQNGKTTFYVCRGQRCLPPTHDPSALREIR